MILPRVYNRNGGRVSYSIIVQCNSCWGRVMIFIMIFICVVFDLWWCHGNCSNTRPFLVHIVWLASIHCVSTVTHEYDYKGHNPASRAVPLYSATKQESKPFQNHYFWLKIAQMCLLITRMATTTIYIAFYKTSFFPYIANREAIYVRSTFQAFFVVFGYKWW